MHWVHLPVVCPKAFKHGFPCSRLHPASTKQDLWLILQEVANPAFDAKHRPEDLQDSNRFLFLHLNLDCVYFNW